MVAVGHEGGSEVGWILSIKRRHQEKVVVVEMCGSNGTRPGIIGEFVSSMLDF